MVDYVSKEGTNAVDRAVELAEEIAVNGMLGSSCDGVGMLTSVELHSTFGVESGETGYFACTGIGS